MMPQERGDKDDVAALLFVDYHLRWLRRQTTFPELAGLLRITTEYLLEHARALILERLRAEWPSTLEKHDAKGAAFNAKLLRNAAGDDTIVHPASVLVLLRECGYDAMDLIAPLFSDLITRIWQLGPGASGHHLALLSHVELERFVFGVNQLRCRHAAMSRCPANVLNHEACEALFSKEWHSKMLPILFREANHMCQPIEDWGLAEKQWLRERKVCRNCDQRVRIYINVSLKQFRNNLTTYFA